MEMEKILSLAKELGISPEEMLKRIEKKKREQSASSEEIAEEIKKEHIIKIEGKKFEEKRVGSTVIRRRKRADTRKEEKKEEAPVVKKVEHRITTEEKASRVAPAKETKEDEFPNFRVIKKPSKVIDGKQAEKQRMEIEKAKEKLEQKIREERTKQKEKKVDKKKPVTKGTKKPNKTTTAKEQIEKDKKSVAEPIVEKSKTTVVKDKDKKEKKDRGRFTKTGDDNLTPKRKKVKKLKTIFDKKKKFKGVNLTDITDDSKVDWSKLTKEEREAREKAKKVSTKPIVKESKKRIKITSEEITVKDLASNLNVKATELIKKLMANGIMATINHSVDIDTATLVANEYGFEIEKISNIEDKIFEKAAQTDKEEDLKPRPPVVTMMGHVDHGKTSLLDRIRATNVTSTEAGGITQHIGAYHVEVDGNKITFIDTPGHEAFTAMRARGAKITDIVILIVAADDGVMPQTIEAIQHAQAADVPIIVAINKIDKSNANIEKVINQLMEHNLVPEEFGGDTICVKVSAKTGEGIQDLLESILLQTEILELKANPDKNAKGFIVESKIDKGKGIVATVLVSEGTLRVGDSLVAGTNICKVRAMTDYRGKRIKEAGPSTPVEILGFNGVPDAGETVIALKNEKEAKELIEHRINKLKEQTSVQHHKISLEDLQQQILEGELKELKVIIKTDVQGTADAIKSSLEKIKNDEVRVRIIATGVGGITEGDVLLAQASHAVIVGFNVRPDAKARKLAEQEHIEIKTYSIIYDLIDNIKKALEGLLTPEFEEVYHGRAEVRQLFSVPKVGIIAGCHVLDGKITRNSKIRLLRDNIIIHEGVLSSLKRFKDDAKEVQAGYECGIGIANFNDLKVNDIIEAYALEQKERTL